MNGDDGDRSQDDLIQDYLEEKASPAEERRFRLLLAEEAFRRRVAEYAIVHGLLFDQVRQFTQETAACSKPYRRRVIGLAVVVAVLLVAVGSWVVIRSGDTPGPLADETTRSDEDHQPIPTPVAASSIARIAGVTGRVFLVAESGSPNRRRLAEGSTLRSGSVIETVGPGSFALVRFQDGSVITVMGDTKLSCSVEDGRKRLSVVRGNLLGHVASQPEDKPMKIETSVAHAEVIGTDLSLFASRRLAELTVIEGRVRMRRLADDRVIDIRGGETAVASAGSDFVARPTVPASDLWEEDFESGQAERWEVGSWIRGEGKNGPVGCIRSALPEAEDRAPAGQYRVTSPHDWWQGLFRIEEDTHLNFTYKVKDIGWFNIMLDTRSSESGGTYTGSFLYKNVDMWKTEPDVWRTVSIPLRYFHVPPGLKDRQRADPAVGHLVYRFFFSTQENDPGLIIDRVWVSRGAPESIEILGPWH